MHKNQKLQQGTPQIEKRQETLTLNCPLSKLILLSHYNNILLFSHGTKDLLNAPYGFFFKKFVPILCGYQNPTSYGVVFQSH
jgi:hypothetical protein